MKFLMVSSLAVSNTSSQLDDGGRGTPYTVSRRMLLSGPSADRPVHRAAFIAAGSSSETTSVLCAVLERVARLTLLCPLLVSRSAPILWLAAHAGTCAAYRRSRTRVMNLSTIRVEAQAREIRFITGSCTPSSSCRCWPLCFSTLRTARRRSASPPLQSAPLKRRRTTSGDEPPASSCRAAPQLSLATRSRTRPVLPLADSLLPHLPELARQSVRPRAQELYLTALLLLRGRLQLRVLPLWPASQWDSTLALVLQELFGEDFTLALAQRLCSALVWAMPHLGWPLRRVLPYVLSPDAARLARLAAPEQPAAHPSQGAGPHRIALNMLHRGFFDATLLVMTFFETYTGPSEAFSMLTAQVILPSMFGLGTLQATALVIYPIEGEQLGKTGEYDHTVPLDLPRQAWLGRLLASRSRRACPCQPLFDITPDLFSKLFNQALVSESLGPLCATPYGLRHGGASRDRATRSRSLADIQRRGNWRCPTSMKRYEKSGRLGLQLQKLSVSVQQRVKQAQEHLSELFELAYVRPSRAAGGSTAASSWRSSAATGTSAGRFAGGKLE